MECEMETRDVCHHEERSSHQPTQHDTDIVTSTIYYMMLTDHYDRVTRPPVTIKGLQGS